MKASGIMKSFTTVSYWIPVQFQEMQPATCGDELLVTSSIPRDDNCRVNVFDNLFSLRCVKKVSAKMHPPLTLHKHPMCAEIIEQFQKCHIDHPIAKFFGECTDLKMKLDRCFRSEKAVKRKANFEESKKLKERLQAYRKETAEKS